MESVALCVNGERAASLLGLREELNAHTIGECRVIFVMRTDRNKCGDAKCYFNG
jgi:hypothetical protein